MKLFKTVALITFFSALTRVAGFFFRIFLSRVLGAEALGIYQVASSIFGVLLTVVSSGLPLIISRLNAGYHATKEEKKEGPLVTVAIIFSVIVSVILCLIVLLFKRVFASFTDARCIEILIILLPAIIFSSVYSVFRGALWGRDNYFSLCVSELFEQVVRILVCILLVSPALSAIQNASSVAWSMTIACLASMIFVMLLFFFYGGQMSKPQKNILKPLLKQSAPITAIRVAGSFIQPLVALIVPARLCAIGYTMGQAMSIFGVAMGMTFPLLFVPSTIIGSLSTALIPDMSKAVAQNNQSHIDNRVRTSIIFSLFVSCIFVPAYLGVGEQAGVFIYNNALSGTLLQMASWILIPLGLTHITSALLNSLGMEMKSFVSYFVGAIFMFLALWFLPSLVGINALVYALGISHVVTALINIYILKRKVKNLKILKPLLLMLIFIIPSSAITSFVASLCSFALPLFFTLALSCIVGTAFFIMLCMVFNVVGIQAVFSLFKKKFNFKPFKFKKLFKKG